MTSQAEKKRRKKREQQRRAEDIGLTPLASAPSKQPNGRNRRPQGEAASDPRKTALDARCRLAGVDTSAKGRRAVDDEHSGSQLGLCLWHRLSDREAGRCWDAWKRWSAAMHRYEKRILERSVHPKTQKIEMEPERVEAPDHHTVDVRSEQERDQSVVNEWMRWKGVEMEVGNPAMALIREARVSEMQLWQDASPTRRGVFTVYAIRDLMRAERGG